MMQFFVLLYNTGRTSDDWYELGSNICVHLYISRCPKLPVFCHLVSCGDRECNAKVFSFLFFFFNQLICPPLTAATAVCRLVNLVNSEVLLNCDQPVHQQQKCCHMTLQFVKKGTVLGFVSHLVQFKPPY